MLDMQMQQEDEAAFWEFFDASFQNRQVRNAIKEDPTALVVWHEILSDSAFGWDIPKEKYTNPSEGDIELLKFYEKNSDWVMTPLLSLDFEDTLSGWSMKSVLM
jgi:hypothetical protein